MSKTVLQRIKSRLFQRALEDPDTILHRAVLARGGLRKGHRAEISTAAAQSLALTGEGPFTVVAPDWGEGPVGTHEGQFPAIRAHVIEDAIVSAYTPAVVVRDRLLLPSHLIEHADRVSTDDGGLFRKRPSGVFVARDAAREIPKAIHIGGAGAFNWFHFIVECLPKAWLAQRLPSAFDDFALLLPEECKSMPSFSDAVRVFSNDRPLNYLSRDKRANVKDLVTFDDISIGPFNMVPGEWPQVTDYSQHDAELKSFMDRFRKGILGAHAPPDSGRRIFLARSGVRRNYNQDQLLDIAKNYGFEAVFLEGLSLREQAQAFAGASAVIGASGAAWVGMIFCERPFIGLSWLPAPYNAFCSYATLAHLLGHRLMFIEAKTVRKLTSTGDAYRADYTVSPSEFEDAIRKVLGQVSK